MNKKTFLINLLPLCIAIFFIKWFFFFNTKLDIDFLTKFIFEIKDWQYFTFIYNLSNLNFNPSYNPNLTNLKFIPLPIYSLLYHSIFFKFFNIYGFIVLDIFIILTFFIIFFNFFKILGLAKIESIFFIFLIFCTSSIIDYFQLTNVRYLGILGDFYNLRVPRPSISHLYLFSFFLLLISIKKDNELKNGVLVLIGILFSLMWGSFYYNLVVSGITFIIYYLYLTYNSNQNLFKYFKDTFLVLISFIFVSIPIIYLIINSEPDWLIRVGLVELNVSKKKILLIHFIKRILSIKFLIIFTLITASYLFLKSKKIYKKEGINLLYFIFLGSFLGPLIFIIVSPSISEPYHFANTLVTLSFFITLTFFYLILQMFLRNISLNSRIFKVFIFFLLIFYSIHNFSLSKKNELDFHKINFSQLVTEIKNNNLDKNSEILTFDGRLQAYLILNNYNNLTNTLGIFTSFSDKMIEEKLIQVFKFFDLNKIDFYNFLKNKKHGWRYINNNIGETFYMKYQANNLITYQNSKDFNYEETKYILKASPLHSQQLIIPSFEIKRLINKFDHSPNNNKINPELIVINTNNLLTKNLSISTTLYCSKKINKDYIIYFLKKDNLAC